MAKERSPLSEISRPGAAIGYTYSSMQPTEHGSGSRVYTKSFRIGRKDSRGKFDSVECIEPGREYIVEAVLSCFPPEENPDAGYWLWAHGSVRLELRAENLDSLLVQPDLNGLVQGGSSNFAIVVDESEFRNGEKVEFQIFVPDNVSCPTFLFLELVGFKISGNSALSTVLAQGNVSFSDNSAADHLGVFKAMKINLEERVGDNIAFLYVDRVNENKMSIRGWNSIVCWPSIERLYATIDPNISMADRLKKGRSPAFILSTMYRYSTQHLAKLIEWLDKLIHVFGESLCIVVCDSTDIEIPWELVFLEEDSVEFLGARAQVVRWSHVRGKHSEFVKFETSERTHVGGVIGYLDGALRTEEERLALSGLTSGSLEQTVRSAVLRLADQESICLAYFACHGKFIGSNSAPESYHRLHADGDAADSVLEIDFWLARRSHGKLPIAFINACHSGRVRPDNRGVLEGLPLPFLKGIAEGYVGTTGVVSDMIASNVGARVLSGLGQGVPIGRIFQEIRASAAEGITLRKILECALGDTCEDKIDKLLFTFMYIYYGNPNLSIAMDNICKDD